MELFELGQTALGRIPHWGGSVRGWSIHVDTFRCWCGSKLSMCVHEVRVYLFWSLFLSICVLQPPKNMALHVQHGNWFLFIPSSTVLCDYIAILPLFKVKFRSYPGCVHPRSRPMCLHGSCFYCTGDTRYHLSQRICCMFVFLHSALLGLGSNCILHISYQFISLYIYICIHNTILWYSYVYTCKSVVYISSDISTV